jgi:predicted DNA-binding transcriptional regulator AlpA
MPRASATARHISGGLIKAGKFVKPIRLVENRIGFIESEIDSWLKAKVEERD